MKRYAIGVAVLAVTGSVCAQAVQWTEAEGGNGHWYEFQDGTGSNWNNHRQAALAAGGDLACPIDESTDTYLKYLMEAMGDCVNLDYISIGGLQTQGQGEPAGGWHWVSGAEWSWTNWHPGEPNDSGGDESALVYTGANCGGLWNDINPTLDNLNRGYIIEWSADCNDDGIVDYGQILDGTYADDDGNGVPDCCDAGTPCDAPANAPVQWTEADGGNGHWYEVVVSSPSWITWVDSDNESQAAGGHLATVTSSEENQFIFAMIQPIAELWNSGQWDGPWIGGYQDTEAPDYSEPAGGWTWVTSEPWDYTNWEPGQPDDNTALGPEIYLRYWQRDGDTWNDQRNDSETHGYIIEWSADCNDDGIVDYGQILDGSLEDLDGNGIPDCCDEGSPCFPPDCNDNGYDDAIDIANGTSQDCNTNGVPDECDLTDGTSQDCNTNGVPDECDLADGTSSDCNANSIPDECESLADCDGDGTSDACEILDGALDVNPADGVPDECQGLPAGACCVNGACMMGTAASCFAAEGSYAGDGVSCADAGCPADCPTDVFADGVTDINDLLLILSEFGSVCP